jgi:hypothetical protein
MLFAGGLRAASWGRAALCTPLLACTGAADIFLHSGAAHKIGDPKAGLIRQGIDRGLVTITIPGRGMHMAFNSGQTVTAIGIGIGAGSVQFVEKGTNTTWLR